MRTSNQDLNRTYFVVAIDPTTISIDESDIKAHRRGRVLFHAKFTSDITLKLSYTSGVLLSFLSYEEAEQFLTYRLNDVSRDLSVYEYGFQKESIEYKGLCKLLDESKNIEFHRGWILRLKPKLQMLKESSVYRVDMTGPLCARNKTITLSSPK